MRKRFMTVALISAIVASMSLSSCIGSFALFNKLLSWNNKVSDKFINELVFFAFWVVPVYEVAFTADMLVLNTIEFWSGSSPLAQNSKIIEGSDAKYLVESDATGYTITNLTDNSKTRLEFDADEQTWSVIGQSGTEYPLMTFVDDTHMKVATGNGEMMLIEKTQEGLYAYQKAIYDNVNVFANK